MNNQIIYKWFKRVLNSCPQNVPLKLRAVFNLCRFHGNGAILVFSQPFEFSHHTIQLLPFLMKPQDLLCSEESGLVEHPKSFSKCFAGHLRIPWNGYVFKRHCREQAITHILICHIPYSVSHGSDARRTQHITRSFTRVLEDNLVRRIANIGQ